MSWLNKSNASNGTIKNIINPDYSTHTHSININPASEMFSYNNFYAGKDIKEIIRFMKDKEALGDSSTVHMIINATQDKAKIHKYVKKEFPELYQRNKAIIDYSLKHKKEA